MKIAVVQASSQASKNEMLYKYTKKYAKDSYLFAQINNGNVVSLPLGEEYTYTGEKNLEETIKALFSEPFGGGYPKSEAKRKIADAKKLKEIKAKSQIDFEMFLNKLDLDMVKKVKHKIHAQ